MPNPETVLIIPAAGAGTRLQSSGPKVLSHAAGRPMIDHLFDLYRRTVQRFVLVVHPSAEAAVKAHCRIAAPDVDVTYACQPEPTGMLDAILIAIDEVRGLGPHSEPRRIWITWCDQIGVHPDTITGLRQMSEERSDAQVIMPTSRQSAPYTHLERGPDGQITAVRLRREGDAMPPFGESDIGPFSLSRESGFEWLARFAGETPLAVATRERNFLPFIPWMVANGQRVLTFPCRDAMEAIGVDTPDDRRRLEQYLEERRQS